MSKESRGIPKKSESEVWPIFSSWSDIEQYLGKICAENPKKAGTLFENFCTAFLEKSDFSRGQYSNVWSLEGVPREVRNHLNISTTDYGVDRVCRTMDGKYGVVQCKFTAREQKKILNWTQDNISSWLAASTRADLRILFTNADSLDQVSLDKARETQFVLINYSHLQALTRENLAEIVSHLNDKAPEVRPPVQPRHYQTEAIERTETGFSKHDRGKLILPCGAGKTLTAYWIKEKVNSKKTLVLVPSLALLAQFKNEWRKQENENIRFFCVCSEKDITGDIDEATINIEEIGAEVTTDPKEIRRLLLTFDGPMVVYSTYQSSPKIAEALAWKQRFKRGRISPEYRGHGLEVVTGV